MGEIGGRRRTSVHITPRRASRLYFLVRTLEERPRTRDEILRGLEIGLRTFYRELDLLKRCGVRVRLRDKLYDLTASTAPPAGRLPFPDPQLNFAEMAELARCNCDAGRRLAALLDSVIAPPSSSSTRPGVRGGRKKGG